MKASEMARKLLHEVENREEDPEVSFPYVEQWGQRGSRKGHTIPIDDLVYCEGTVYLLEKPRLNTVERIPEKVWVLMRRRLRNFLDQYRESLRYRNA